jgi:hypothetical protein
MAFTSAQVDRLLSAAAPRLPLLQGDLPRQPAAASLRVADAELLFPGTVKPQAALAGLLLRTGCWAESHTVAQDLHTAEGSYWHAIIHRMEPDAFNAQYWFRQIGQHAIFPELLRGAAGVLANGGPRHWRLKTSWDPIAFVEWCGEAVKSGGGIEAAAIEIQMLEWQLLFDWCSNGRS